MDNSPFSPFVARHRTVKDVRRRQSQLPSDLIDWDAPEIPELEKQRIIYEQIIQDCNEDHAIETLLNEEIFQVAYEVLTETTRKQYEDESQKDRSQINLLLGQIKLFEAHCQELETQHKESEARWREIESQKVALEGRNHESAEKQEYLESQNKELSVRLQKLETQIQEYECHNKEMEETYRDLEFHKQELETEISCQLDTLIMKKLEADDLRRKLDGSLCRLLYYKRLANKVSH